MYRKNILQSSFSKNYKIKQSTPFLILQTRNSFHEKKLILLKENKKTHKILHNNKIPLLYLLA